jgi:hypothetical protein
MGPARSHLIQLRQFRARHGTSDGTTTDVGDAILERAKQLKRFVKQRRATADARDAIHHWKLTAQRLADDSDKAERDVGRLLNDMLTSQSGGLREGEVSAHLDVVIGMHLRRIAGSAV